MQPGVLCPKGHGRSDDSAQPQTDVPSVQNDVTLEGDSSFGNLLTNTVNESQQENSEAQYDARICDLVIEGATATVEYTTPVDANLVVAIYTEDGSKLLGSGLAAVSPEDSIAEVAIEIPTMPYYFRAGAYLLDAATNDPVSEEFKTDRYTKTMQDILAATVDDFNPELVLNLDSDRTTNFAVFNENTLLAKSGDGEIQITDNGSGVYTIENADERFLAMKPGDTFAYTYPDGTVLIVNAASVSVNGTTVTVTDNPDADLSTVFDFVKIEEDSYDKDYTYDDSTLAEGLTVIGDEEFAADQEEPQAAAFGLGIDVDKKGTMDVIRGGTAITVTPTYKNCAGLTDIEPNLTIESWSGKKGESYQTVPDGQFTVTPNADGTFTVTKAPGANVDSTRKYRAELTFDGGAQPAYCNLTVKSGTAKAAVTGTPVLYKSDRFSRSSFRINVTDKTVNPIAKVEIKDTKLAALYEIHDYGNGEFAIGFRNNTVGAVKSASIPLNVFFEGNGSAKPNATLTLKLQIR